MLVLPPLARGGVLLWTQTLIQAAALTLFFITLAKQLFRPGKFPLPPLLTWPLLTLIGLILIAGWLSCDPMRSFEAVAMFASYLLVFLVSLAVVETRKQEMALAYVLIGSAGLVAGIALLEAVGMKLPFWIFLGRDHHTGLAGPFGNHNHFAGYLEMTLPMVIGVMLARPGSREFQVLMIGVLAFLTATLGLSLSRGGMISILCAFVFMGACLKRQKLDWKRYKLFILIPVLCLLVMTLLDTRVSQRMGTLVQGVQSMAFRQKVWQSSLDLVRENPWKGTGPGTFARAVIARNPAGFNFLPQHAHNDWLEFTTETGIGFLIIAVWLVFAFFKTGRQKLKSSSCQARGITLGAMGGVVAILVHSLYDFNLHIPSNALTFSVLAALALSPVKKRRWPGPKPILVRPALPNGFKILGASLIGIGYAGLVAWLGLLMGSRYAFDQGRLHIKTHDYPGAVSYFLNAKKILSRTDKMGKPALQITRPDRVRIHIQLAKALNMKARSTPSGQMAQQDLEQAKRYLNTALKLDPENYRANSWMARTLAMLSQDPIDFYEKAAFLRPTGIAIHYDLIRHLHQRGLKQKIPELAFHIAMIYPAYAEKLLKAPFCNRTVKERIRAGLKRAVQENTTPRFALIHLSNMALEEGAIKDAARYYGKALTHRPQDNFAQHQIHLGMLLLRSGQGQKAERAFISGLKTSQNFANDLDLIRGIYKKQGRPEAFIRFVSHLESTLYPSRDIDLAKAACLVEMNRIKAAQKSLTLFLQKGEDARAYNLLSVIAQRRKDWDAMAVAAQKAVALTPENSSYWHRLAWARSSQGRLDQAEQAADRSVLAAEAPNYWYHVQRADIRIRRNRFEKALEDAALAGALASNRPLPEYLMARAWLGAGQKNKALEHITRALILDPENQTFIWFKKRCKAP